MGLVCLRSPESGPFPSELVAHPNPFPKQPSWGRGSVTAAPSPTRVSKTEKREVVKADDLCPCSLLGAQHQDAYAGESGI